jgi:hypothetical protein
VPGFAGGATQPFVHHDDSTVLLPDRAKEPRPRLVCYGTPAGDNCMYIAGAEGGGPASHPRQRSAVRRLQHTPLRSAYCRPPTGRRQPSGGSRSPIQSLRPHRMAQAHHPGLPITCFSLQKTARRGRSRVRQSRCGAAVCCGQSARERRRKLLHVPRLPSHECKRHCFVAILHSNAFPFLATNGNQDLTRGGPADSLLFRVAGLKPCASGIRRQQP